MKNSVKRGERKATSNLYDPRNGHPAIRIERLRLGSEPSDQARTNYFSIFLIESGAGTFWADSSKFAFAADSLIFFTPYQQIRFVPDSLAQGAVIQFHANFLCVETFHAEAGCSGVLFNDPYGSPVVELNEQSKLEVINLIGTLRREQDEQSLAFGEVMLASLKVLLILAARLKVPKIGDSRTGTIDSRHPALIQLRELIEENYQTLHTPAEYAERLHLTPKTLGRIVREYLGTTPTDLIRNRILIHAKWQLLHTLKPVKEIAGELGFSDELYFSRIFKKATGYSPTFFREFETEIRGGSNLSMFLDHSPILHPSEQADT